MRKEAVYAVILNVALFRGMRVAIAADPRYLRFSVIEDGATMHYNLRVRARSLSLSLSFSFSFSLVRPWCAFRVFAFCVLRLLFLEALAFGRRRAVRCGSWVLGVWALLRSSAGWASASVALDIRPARALRRRAVIVMIILVVVVAFIMAWVVLLR